MKTVGIIGGISPESTVEYYRFIIERYRERQQDENYPSIIINSINLKRMLELIPANLPGAIDYLVQEITRLAKAGADFAAISANTPHIVFDEVQRLVPIRLISIVEATCDAAKARGFKRLGLFGTRFTMEGRFYPHGLSRAGIEMVTPSAAEQDFIHEHYLEEMVKGIFHDETRNRLLAIAARLREEDRIEGLILGGTELPLILRDSAVNGVHFLDTTQIHVEAIVEELVAAN